MIIADLEYWDNKLHALSPEAWAEFLRLWSTADGTEEQPKANTYHVVVRTPQRLTYEESGRIQALGIKLKISPLPGNQLTKIQDHEEPVSSYEAVQPRDLLTGAAVQIHIADFALLAIREVTWLDDACTQEVQRHLDEGWCIIAVCPPNAQRRPDYILGRTKKA